MNIQRTIATLVSIAALHSVGAPAQDLFRATFSATCLSLNPTTGRIVTTQLTDRDIIAEATGISPKNYAALREFALVFNTTADSLQVVDTNGTTIVDVIHFDGGTATTDGRQIDRLTYMFLPGQTNELGAETNVFGTALITERASRSGTTNEVNRANITGRVQYVLTGTNVLGSTNVFTISTNSVSVTNTNSGTNVTVTVTNVPPGFFMTSTNIVFDPTARICQGTFTAGTRFPPQVTITTTNVTATNVTTPVVTTPIVTTTSGTTTTGGVNTGTTTTGGVSTGTTTTGGVSTGTTTTTNP